MKKIVPIILVFTICCSLLFVPVVSGTTAGWTDQDEYLFLEQIGIEKENLGFNQPITKGEFVADALKLLYPYSDFSNSKWQEESTFWDVEKNHKYYSQIKAAKELNIITGDLNHQFHPDQVITPVDAVAVLARGLGYQYYIDAYGGYPSGYLKIAKETGLSNGIDFSKTELTFGTKVKLLYNALFSDLVLVDSVSGKEITVKKEKEQNLLGKQYHIYQYDVKLVDNGITSLIGESIHNQSKVVLEEMKTGNRITADHNNSGLADHLGSRSEVFLYENEGTTKLIFYKLNSVSKEYQLKGDQILQVYSTYLEYEPEKNSSKTEKLSFGSISPVLIFNGVILNQYSNDLMKPEDGVVRLVDFEGNGKIELVEISSFNYAGDMENLSEETRNIVVESYNQDTEYLTCKFNPVKSLKLDSQLVEYKIISSQINTLEQIKENQIVSVAQAPEQLNGKDFYFLFVSDEVISGTVEWISNDDNEVSLSGTVYQLSGSISKIKTGYLSRLENAGELKIRLDVLGKIAYVDLISNDNKNYAYLINAGVKSQADQTVLLKVFTKEKSIETLELSPKALIDGEKAVPKDDETLAQAQIKKIMKRQDVLKRPVGAPGENEYLSRPVILEVNEEKLITRIDTDNPNHPVDPKASNIYKDQTLIAYSDEEVDDGKALKAGYRSVRNSSVNMNIYALDGRFYINSETLIMNVPDIDPNGLGDLSATLTDTNYGINLQAVDYRMVKLCERSLEDKNYRIMKVTEFDNRLRNDIQAYDIDPDTGVASLVVVRGRTDIYAYGLTPVASENKLLIFLRLAEVYHEYLNKTVYKIYYTSDGKSESSSLVDQDDLYFPYSMLIFGGKDKDTPYNKEVLKLKSGEVIRLFEKGGWLTHIERVYSIDHIKDYESSTLFPSNTQNPYSITLHSSVPMPFDRRNYWQQLGSNETYSLGTLYVKSIFGKRLNSYIGIQRPESIKLNDIATYTQTMYDVTGAQIIVIDIDKTGEVRTKSGQLKDIITVDQTGGVLENASMVLFRHRYYRFETLIVVNDQRLYV